MLQGSCYFIKIQIILFWSKITSWTWDEYPHNRNHIKRRIGNGQIASPRWCQIDCRCYRTLPRKMLSTLFTDAILSTDSCTLWSFHLLNLQRCRKPVVHMGSYVMYLTLCLEEKENSISNHRRENDPKVSNSGEQHCFLRANIFLICAKLTVSNDP